MDKIWKVEGRDELYSDRELRNLIKSGELTKEDMISSDIIKEPVKIGDTIYCVFIK